MIAKSNSSGGSDESVNSNEIELTLFIVLRTYDREHFYKSYTREIPAIVEVNRVVKRRKKRNNSAEYHETYL